MVAKRIYLFLLAFVAVFGIYMIGVETKASDETPSIEQIDGASIRLTDPMGLRFKAKVNGTFTGENVRYGFLLTRGSFTKDQMLTLYSNDYAEAIFADGLSVEEDGTYFYVSVVNIPTEYIESNITALAFVDVDGIKTYATLSTTRNIKQVATAISSDPAYAELPFIKNIISASTLQLNGGKIVNEYEYTITKCGDFGTSVASGYDLNIGTKANYTKVCNNYWDRIYLNYDESKDLYVVVTTGTAPENYEYVLGGHSTCSDKTGLATFYKLVAACKNKQMYLKFTYPTTMSCSVKVMADSSIEKLTGAKFSFSDGATLPQAYKDYYDFAGWYDNALFEGESITTYTGSTAKTYYAKYTPANYTITYDLQGGACNETLTTSYSIESETIILPTADKMSITDGTFLGWYDNKNGSGTPITQLSTGSNGNVTIYACWEINTVNDLNISAIDTTALNAMNTENSKPADIIVVPSLTNGKYSLVNTNLSNAYSEKVYTFSTNAFVSIADAIAAAKAGDTIYVSAGSYSANISISKQVKIYGPNTNILGKDTRNSAASVTGLLTIAANECTVNGLEFTKNVIVSANNATIDYCYINCAPSTVCVGGNRKACIVNGVASISNLTVQNSYLMVKGATASYLTNYISIGTITNIYVRNNYITNNCTTNGAADGMMLYTYNGVLEFVGNEVRFATTNWLIKAGQYDSNPTTITIKDNILAGRNSMCTCTIGFQYCKSTTVATVMNNEFYNVDPATILFSGNANGKLTIEYNFFDNQKSCKISSKLVTTCNHNCYMGTKITTGDNIIDISKDAVTYSSLAAVKAAYQTYLESLN